MEQPLWTSNIWFLCPLAIIKCKVTPLLIVNMISMNSELCFQARDYVEIVFSGTAGVTPSCLFATEQRVRCWKRSILRQPELTVSLPLHVSRHASARVIQRLCNLAWADGGKCNLKFGGVQHRTERRATEEPTWVSRPTVWVPARQGKHTHKFSVTSRPTETRNWQAPSPAATRSNEPLMRTETGKECSAETWVCSLFTALGQNLWQSPYHITMRHPNKTTNK